MRVCSLASSSKGNCTVIYNDDEIILVDMGITLKDLEEKFNRLNLDIAKLKAVLVSHEHGDHIKGINTLCKKYNVQVYCHYDAYDGIRSKIGVDDASIIRFGDVPFLVGKFMVNSFNVSHDVFCVGFNIYENSNKVSIVTDLGYTTTEIVERLYNSRLVILEANHDEKMVVASTKYPAMLKNRILSKKGHLSNHNSAKVVVDLAQHNVRQVLFAHLSEETNTPEKCYQTICDYLIASGITPNIHIKLDIAKPNGVGPIYVVK